MEYTVVDARRFDAPVIRWFAAPELPSSESTRRARALWMMSWLLLAIVTATLGIAVAVEPDTLTRRAVTITAVAVLVALLHEINRRGRTILASWLFVIGLTLIVTQRAWGTGGIHAPVSVFYTLFILMAGALLGARASIRTAMLCVAGALFLTAAEEVGWLIAPAGASPPAGSFMFVMLTIGLALVVQSLITPRERKAARLSDDLVQMVVHDMQSPIMVLMAQLAMLREDAPRRMVSRVDEAIGGAKTLSRMTSNLLDVNRFAARRMPVEREPTDVAGVARSVVSSMSLLEPGRAIEVSGDASAMCCCDADLVRRILENLVSNAIKHSPIEGKVRIYVTSVAGQGAQGSASARGGHVRVAVQDEGAGVPEEARRRIFEKFGAASLRTGSGYHSTGLGLAFCKLAVESHGGTIRLEDAIPHGSVFVIELPA